MTDPTRATTAELLEVRSTFTGTRTRAADRLLAAAETALAGAARIMGLGGLRMSSSVTPHGDLDVRLTLERGWHRGEIGARNPLGDATALLDGLRDAAVRAVRRHGLCERRNLDAIVRDHRWCYDASPIMVAMLAEAGVDRSAHLRRLLRNQEVNGITSRVEFGSPTGKATRTRDAHATVQAGMDGMPHHIASMAGLTVQLHHVEIGTSAAWGDRMHLGRKPALELRDTVLPGVVRRAAPCLALGELVGHPYLRLVDSPAGQVVSRGRATLLLCNPETIPYDDVPSDALARIAAIHAGHAILSDRIRLTTTGEGMSVERQAALF